MRLDPGVARRKFEREAARLDRQAAQLQRWGCTVREVAYPHVDLVFISPHPLQVVVPVNVPGSPGQMGMQNLIYPTLSPRPLGVRIGLDDFDQRAPSVTFLDPWSWQPMEEGAIVGRGAHRDDTGVVRQVLLSDHPITGRPFLCMRGVREYHEHPQHSGDDWMLYRNALGLFHVVQTIWRTCVHLPRPVMLVAFGSIPLVWNVK